MPSTEIIFKKTEIHELEDGTRVLTTSLVSRVKIWCDIEAETQVIFLSPYDGEYAQELDFKLVCTFPNCKTFNYTSVDLPSGVQAFEDQETIYGSCYHH